MSTTSDSGHNDVFGRHVCEYETHAAMSDNVVNALRENKYIVNTYGLDGTIYRDHWTIQFSNGYGASIARTNMTYGGRDGLFELAVLREDGTLDFSNPITSDVIGWLSREEVAEVLDRIEALPFTFTSSNPIASDLFDD